MKKIFFIVFLFNCFSIIAQNSGLIVDERGRLFNRDEKVFQKMKDSLKKAEEIPLIVSKDGDDDCRYYKDKDNLLDQFEGTWVCSNDSIFLKFIIKKKVMAKTYDVLRDIVIGECQYIKNGVEEFNTLSQLANDFGDVRRYSMHGYGVYGYRPPSNHCSCGPKRSLICSDCKADDKVVVALDMTDPLSKSSADVYLRNLQTDPPTLKVQIRQSWLSIIELEPMTRIFSLPTGYFIFTKQD